MYDLVIIGSGPGGYVAAIRAAQLGLKTACIEKEKTLGGTCLNVGCIPSKALLYDSEVHKDLATMMERKRGVVQGFTSGIELLFAKNKVDWIKGEATLKNGIVSVNGQIIETKNVILAAGSVPATLPFLKIDEKQILTSTGMLSLNKIPKRLLVIGAGIIGCELGSVYRRLGSEVIFIEFLDKICAGFDSAISRGLLKALTAQGMEFLLSHKVISAKGTKLTLENKGEIEGDCILVAIGRKPNSSQFDVEKDAKGFIKIDGSFRTSIPHVFAIGDLIEGPMLAHKASEEGVAVVEMLAGHNAAVNYMAIPNVIYTHPEAASVGLTEEEIKSRGIAYKSSQFPFKANSRARCIDNTEGFVKMLAEEQTKRILGVHILGPNASELIGEATLAIQLKATADQLANTCHAHPTLSESLKEAALGLFQKPIHI